MQEEFPGRPFLTLTPHISHELKDSHFISFVKILFISEANQEHKR